MFKKLLIKSQLFVWYTRTNILENELTGSDPRRRQLVFLISDGNKHDWPRIERERYEALLARFPGDSELIGILNGRDKWKTIQLNRLNSQKKLFVQALWR